MLLPHHLSRGSRPALVQVAVITLRGEMGTGDRPSLQAAQQGREGAAVMCHGEGQHCNEAALSDWEGGLTIWGCSTGSMGSYKHL